METLLDNLLYEVLSIVIVVAAVVLLYSAVRLKIKRQEEQEQ